MWLFALTYVKFWNLLILTSWVYNRSYIYVLLGYFFPQQVKNLKQQCESKDAKFEQYECEIEEARALAREETTRCKAAKEVIRVLTGQVCFLSILSLWFSCGWWLMWHAVFCKPWFYRYRCFRLLIIILYWINLKSSIWSFLSSSWWWHSHLHRLPFNLS